MSLATADVETLRCITGESKWELCLRLKKAREAVAELEARIEKLLEVAP
ncbi:hypothetical protein [Pyrobaculum ferrireducens]|nr:hypothetical protein [Pyrobaculum ferrireducens]